MDIPRFLAPCLAHIPQSYALGTLGGEEALSKTKWGSRKTLTSSDSPPIAAGPARTPSASSDLPGPWPPLLGRTSSSQAGPVLGAGTAGPLSLEFQPVASVGHMDRPTCI